MNEKKSSSWQDPAVARNFLDERRGAIPFAADQLAVMVRLAHHFRPQVRRILDLGCGDGFLARALLAEFPQSAALLVDHSETMIDRARQAMTPYADRCQIAFGDLQNPLRELVSGPAPDLIVSGFAIHHLPHVRKRSLYAELFDVLAPGGLFINCEHVASASAEIESLYDSAYIDHISAHTGKDRAVVEREYHARPDKADNILEYTETQVNWLHEIGFRHADCYFKWFELAVFGGVKPN